MAPEDEHLHIPPGTSLGRPDHGTPYHLEYCPLAIAYYSGLNYGNRNATNVSSTVNIAMSYAAAAVSSVAIAIVLRRFIIGNYALRMKSGNQILFNSATSFAALAGAAVTNAIVMRSQELQ